MTTPFRKRNKKFNTSGHAHFLTFSCIKRMALLTNDVWRGWLAESIRKKCDEHEIALWAYVFMPEHVHLLLKPRREIYDLAKFEQSAKLSFSRKLIIHLSRNSAETLERFRVGDGFKFWQEGGGHDLNIWRHGNGRREGYLLSFKSTETSAGLFTGAMALVEFSVA